MTVFRMMTDPAFKGGRRQECWENARREFWARIRRGGEASYWLGEVVGVGRDESPSKRTAPVPHAFVVVRGRVADATPFIVGRGGRWSRMATVPARGYWRPGARYIGLERLDAGELRAGVFGAALRERMERLWPR